MKPIKKIRLVFVFSLFVGVLLALQIRSIRRVDILIQRSSSKDLMAELRVFQVANEELRRRLTEQEKTLEKINTQFASRSLEDEIRDLRLLSGEVPVSGEGVEITISQTVDEFWINDLVAQLAAAGAEAVAINDIRLTSSTAGLRAIGDGLLMRRHFLRPIFRIVAVGPERQLQNAVSQNGGILERMEQSRPGLKIFLTPREKIIIPTLPL